MAWAASIEATYDLHDTSMPYIPGHEDEQRKLTYNVTLNDGHGGVTVPFVLIFNSPPVFEAGPSSGFSFDEGPSEAVWEFADNLAFRDVDPSDHHSVSWESMYTGPGTAPSETLSFEMLNDTSNGTGGLARWDYQVEQSALAAMAAGRDAGRGRSPSRSTTGMAASPHTCSPSRSTDRTRRASTSPDHRRAHRQEPSRYGCGHQKAGEVASAFGCFQPTFLWRGCNRLT